MKPAQVLSTENALKFKCDQALCTENALKIGRPKNIFIIIIFRFEKKEVDVFECVRVNCVTYK